MISIKIDDISFLDAERLTSKEHSDPKMSISDIDENGFRTVNFSFKIASQDRWSLSVYKETAHESFGFGQGSTHQEKPEDVVNKTNSFIKLNREV